MQSGEVSKSDLELTGRMDSRFLIEYQKYRPLVTDLVDKFSLEELVDLANLLPFAGEIAWVVLPKSLVAAPVSPFRLERWLVGVVKRPRQQSKLEVAVYCAAAAQFAVSKLLLEVERAAQQQLGRLATIKQLMDLARLKSEYLGTAIKRGGQEALQKVRETKDGRDQGQDPERGEAPGEAQEADRQAPG